MLAEVCNMRGIAEKLTKDICRVYVEKISNINAWTIQKLEFLGRNFEIKVSEYGRVSSL